MISKYVKVNRMSAHLYHISPFSVCHIGGFVVSHLPQRAADTMLVPNFPCFTHNIDFSIGAVVASLLGTCCYTLSA